MKGSPKFKVNDLVRTGRYSSSVEYKVINVFWYESTNRARLPSQYKYTRVRTDNPETIEHFFEYQIEDATILSEEEIFSNKFSGKTISSVDLDHDSVTVCMTDGTIMNFICHGDDMSYIEFYDENGK